MSYDLNLPATRKSDLEAALAAASPAHEAGAVATPESEDHWAAIKAAALALAEATGRAEDEVTVEAAGHANPGHAPTDGLANEVTYVVVRAVPAPEPADLPTIPDDITT